MIVWLYCDKKNKQPSQAVNTEGMGVAPPLWRLWTFYGVVKRFWQLSKKLHKNSTASRRDFSFTTFTMAVFHYYMGKQWNGRFHGHSWAYSHWAPRECCSTREQQHFFGVMIGLGVWWPFSLEEFFISSSKKKLRVAFTSFTGSPKPWYYEDVGREECLSWWNHEH